MARLKISLTKPGLVIAGERLNSHGRTRLLPLFFANFYNTLAMLAWQPGWSISNCQVFSRGAVSF